MTNITIQPAFDKTVFFCDEEEKRHKAKGITYECCDSTVAVMTQKDLDDWLVIFDAITQADDAADFCDFQSSTRTFEVGGKTLVVVSDSGGEIAHGEFSLFCEDRNIPFQTIVDTLDFKDVDVADMYTGQDPDTDNPELLALVHALSNTPHKV